jgi:hypothetical protein
MLEFNGKEVIKVCKNENDLVKFVGEFKKQENWYTYYIHTVNGYTIVYTDDIYLVLTND